MSYIKTLLIFGVLIYCEFHLGEKRNLFSHLPLNTINKVNDEHNIFNTLSIILIK